MPNYTLLIVGIITDHMKFYQPHYYYQNTHFFIIIIIIKACTILITKDVWHQTPELKGRTHPELKGNHESKGKTNINIIVVTP